MQAKERLTIMASLVSRSDIHGAYDSRCWQRMVFSEFEAAMTSSARPFPCVFGVSGFKADQLRFAFPDPLTPETLAPLLRDYVAQARSFGRMTSFVAFARPGPVQGIEEYRSRFWALLDGLERIDESERPAGVPSELERDHWEFCFAGQPLFVVCSSPAHVLRQSRRSTSFTVTFQPRWVFDGITDSDNPTVERSLARVRKLLEAYDGIAPSPSLGHYGAPGNREYQQYFLDDVNAPAACPFHQLGQGRITPQTRKGRVAS